MDNPRNPRFNSEDRARIRGEIAVAVDIRVAGGLRTKAQMMDLSETGFRMECLTDLPEHRPIFMTLPNFAQLEARIAWKTEWVYGCRFIQPLHTAVFDHILQAYPTFFRPL